MAEGCSVAAVRATAMPEVIGDFGILVAPRDHQASARQRLMLWNDSRKREELTESGRRRTLGYRWAVSVKKMQGILRTIARAS